MGRRWRRIGVVEVVADLAAAGLAVVVDGDMAAADGAAVADGWGHGGGFGGDGFGGGNVSHADSYSGGQSWNHSSNSWQNTSSATKQSDYNTYNANQEAQKQAQYNEMNSLQESHENTEKHMQYQTDSTINNNVGNTNWNGGDGGNPYYCCGGGGGYSSGDVAGAAALGAVGGMGLGMLAGSAMSQPSTTTIINNPAPAPYYGAPAPAIRRSCHWVDSSLSATGRDDDLRLWRNLLLFERDLLPA